MNRYPSPHSHLTTEASPIRSHYERYISLVPDQFPVLSKVRGHPRSYSSNPINKSDSSKPSMLGVQKTYMINPSMVYEQTTGSIASLSNIHPENLVAVGTKTRSLSLLVDRNSEPPFKPNKLNTSDSRAPKNIYSSFDADPSNDPSNYCYGNSKMKQYRFNSLNSSGQWERASADRDLGHNYRESRFAGARSLEREGVTRRFLSEDHFPRNDDTPSPGYYGIDQCISEREDTFLELQGQVTDLNKECAVLQQELDLAKEKLNSTMESIKNFWSPELKRERALRKEQNAKYVLICEQLKAVEVQNRQHVKSLMKYEEEYRRSKNEGGEGGGGTGTGAGNHDNQQNKQIIQQSDLLKRERERHTKELNLLRKTLQEMELRIETQQETMATRDETIKKLMDFVQNQKVISPPSSSSSSSSNQKSKKIEEMMETSVALETAKINETENLNLIKNLELEKKNFLKEINLFKIKLQEIKDEKNMSEKNFNSIRDQQSAFEQQIKLLHKEIELMRNKMKEKNEVIDKKSRQISNLQSDLSLSNSQFTQLNSSLQQQINLMSNNKLKIEKLEEELKEKEIILSSLTLKLTSAQADSSSQDSVVLGLQQVLMEKEKFINRLKEEIENLKNEKEKFSMEMEEKIMENKNKSNRLQEEILSKQENEIDLKSEIGRFKSELNTKDALLSKMESEIYGLKSSQQNLEKNLKKITEENNKLSLESKNNLKEIKISLEMSEEEVRKARMEMEKLLEEKINLENKLKEKEKTERETKNNMALDNMDDEDMPNVKLILEENENRIEKLESALKESIKITAQREVILTEQQMKMDHTERLMESLQEEVESLKKSLEEKDNLLKEQFDDSKKQLSEVYEMKQEAILAAISEKDSHIALLEVAPNRKVENIQEIEKLTGEKIKLQQVLKDLTQSRMKLMNPKGHVRSSSASSLLHYTTHRNQIMEKIDFGTYYVYHNEMVDDDLL